MTVITTQRRMTISSHFDYKEVLRKLQQKGQESFGRHFRLLKEDLPVIVPIVAWMLRDEEVAGQCKIDLNKGIYLAGPVGTGKTQLMHLMRCLTDRHYDYEVYSCPKIAIDFAYSGISAILPYTYSNMDVKRSVAATCCFDDLGKEIDTQHYGNKCKVMEQIMLARYELFIQKGIITHATSSMNTLALEERYGAGMRSRFREMFNKIGFPKTTPDKRKNHLQ